MFVFIQLSYSPQIYVDSHDEAFPLLVITEKIIFIRNQHTARVVICLSKYGCNFPFKTSPLKPHFYSGADFRSYAWGPSKEKAP